MLSIEGLHIEVASSFLQRLKGLLGRADLSANEALLLAPCSNIHTAFMRFPIDVVFLDRQGTILAVFDDVQPWRVAAAWGAHACLEMASGAAASRGLRPGMQLAHGAEAA
jgi:uncharacterized membrane protein (UPF0127 family)